MNAPDTLANFTPEETGRVVPVIKSILPIFLELQDRPDLLASAVLSALVAVLYTPDHADDNVRIDKMQGDILDMLHSMHVELQRDKTIDN